MKEKTKYLLPVLLTLTLIVASSCRQNDLLSIYDNSNTTGGGNGNSGGCGCCCCGCCNGNTNNNASTGEITPYCEPDIPQTTFCSDGTITINAYTDVNFATVSPSCPSGQYTAVGDGVMFLSGVSGRELWTTAHPVSPLIWIKTGDATASIVVIPAGEDSIQVLPDGEVLGYIGSVSTVLGKLIVVSASLGNCGAPVNPLATIGQSILWCGQRVCVKQAVSGLVPAIKLVKMRVSIFDGTYLALSQKEFSLVPSLAPDLYATGLKEIAVTDQGDVIESSTCLPVKSAQGSAISMTATPRSLSISRSAEFLVDDEPWADIAIVNVADSSDLVSLTSGGLPTGIKGPIKNLAGHYVTINTAEAAPAVIEPIEPEANTCVADNPLQNVIALPAQAQALSR